MASTANAMAGINSSQAAYEASAAPSGTAGSEKNVVSKDDFLKLLVAQIRNQNPLNPADGVEFLTQLAQFSQLEQLIEIRTRLETLAPSGSADSSTNRAT